MRRARAASSTKRAREARARAAVMACSCSTCLPRMSAVSFSASARIFAFFFSLSCDHSSRASACRVALLLTGSFVRGLTLPADVRVEAIEFVSDCVSRFSLANACWCCSSRCERATDACGHRGGIVEGAGYWCNPCGECSPCARRKSCTPSPQVLRAAQRALAPPP